MTEVLIDAGIVLFDSLLAGYFFTRLLILYKESERREVGVVFMLNAAGLFLMLGLIDYRLS